MPDLEKLHESKEKILSVIGFKGPSFPARVSRETGISPLFVSAFLSELVSDRKIKVSNMKVGSSPLYYLEGQEADLAKFVDYLNHMERNAFTKLKESQVLDDEAQDPAIRVALRKIKDFAIPLNVRINGETKTFWRHFQTQDEQVMSLVEKLIKEGEGRISAKVEEKKPEVSVTVGAGEKVLEPRTLEVEKETAEEVKKTPREEFKVEHKAEPVIKDSDENSIEKPKKPKQKEPKNFEFVEEVKDYLVGKDIEILEEVSAKKKEFISKVRVDIMFGKQEYYLIAKDKKKVSSDDLTVALQKAQGEKMPALFISPGELDKRAAEHIKEWRNMIKFERIKN